MSKNLQLLFDPARKHTMSEELELGEMHHILIVQILVANGIETSEELWKMLPPKLVKTIFEALLTIMRDVAGMDVVKEANILMKSRVIKVWDELVYKNQSVARKAKVTRALMPPPIDHFMNRYKFFGSFL